MQPAREVAHAQPPVGGLGELDEDAVVPLRDGVLALEIRLHVGADVGHDLDEASPGPLLVVVEPSRHHGVQPTRNTCGKNC